MKEELRERLAEVMAKHCEGYAPAYFLDYRGIDDVLTEIAAAGFVLVDRGVVAELLELADGYYDMLDAAYISNNAARLGREIRDGSRASVRSADWDAWQRRDGDV